MSYQSQGFDLHNITSALRHKVLISPLSLSKQTTPLNSDQSADVVFILSRT